MNDETLRDKMIQKIIDNYDNDQEALFNKLGLDLYEIFESELMKKSNKELFDLLVE